MQKIFFVRHGETTLNQAEVHQSPGVSLSEKGRKQALFLAERCSHLGIDKILASEYVRAKQTAEIIAKQIGKELVFLPTLHEVVRPKEIIGRAQVEQEVQTIKALLIQHAADPSWHYSDEENFFDVISRVKKFISSLSSHTEDTLLIVSHGNFMRHFMAYLLLGDALTPQQFELFYRFFHVSNTGLTECHKNKDGRWKLITWNDYAHLG